MRQTNKSIAKASWQASKHAYHAADKCFTHFAKWVTTDHSGFSRAMVHMPQIGFMDTCKYILVNFIIAMLGALLSGVLTFILIAFGMPLVIQFLLM